MRSRLVLAASLILVLMSVRVLADDVVGSRDPIGIERIPGAEIIDYRRDDEIGPHKVVLGRVERLRREARAEEQLAVAGTLEYVTYQIPQDISVDEVTAHFIAAIEGNLLFRCTGRDCGRSTEWANHVFGKAILYGPDSNQRYLVWETQGRFVSLYVIERGNRRVYAYIQVVQAGAGQPAGDQLLGRRLLAQGWSEVLSLAPAADGSLPADTGGRVADLVAQLEGLKELKPVPTLHVVCHLYRGAATDELLARAGRCARELAGTLAAALPGLKVVGFGAGPLLPRRSSSDRVELVLPERVVSSSAGVGGP